MVLIRNKYGRLIEIEGKVTSGLNTKSTPINSDGNGLPSGLKPINFSKQVEEKQSSFEVTLIKGGSKLI